MTKLKLTAGLMIAFAIALLATPVFAHGVGGRYTLPVPLNYFLVGAAATVALSFVMIGVFVQEQTQDRFSYPRFNLLSIQWTRTLLVGRMSRFFVQAISVAVFGLVLATSLFGENLVFSNFTPTFIWIIWWIGMVFISAFIGNVWAAISPWNIIFRWAEKILGIGRTPLLRYPKWLDVWPAILLFFLFAWVESNYARAGEPRQLATLIIIYTLITWGGMLLFGRHQWLRRGEAFAKLYGYFSKFAPTEVRVINDERCESCEEGCSINLGDCVDCYECFELARPDDRQINLRPPAVGLAREDTVTIGSLVFVALTLSTVTFDGFTATGAWGDFRTALEPRLTLFGDSANTAVGTFGLAMFPVTFLAVYLGFSWAMSRLSGEKVPILQISRIFVYSLIPIALAYHVAHFLVLLLMQGQTILPLLSDPFGWDWDLFGTAHFTIYPLVTTKVEWFLSIGAIVLGHIVAVYLAHVVALRKMSTHAGAMRSQYPMLGLMILYTATSLWIVAQPIVTEA